MDNPLKSLVEQLNQPLADTGRARKNHSVYIDTAQFRRFKQACAARNKSASEVLDKLIALFLEEENKQDTSDQRP